MPNKCCKPRWFPDRANIEQDTSPDGSPAEDFSGTPFKTGIPGRVIDTGGDESFRGREIEPTISSVFECLYFPGVQPTMRLRVVSGIHKDRILNIKYVKVIREQGLIPEQWLYCEEIASA